MINQDHAFDILDRALNATLAAGADAADAALASGSSALTRFANNAIHQNVASESNTLCLRAVRGRQTGCVRTDVLTDDGIEAAAKKAAAMAAVAAEDPEFPGIVGQPTAQPCGVFDDEAAGATPEQRAAAVRDIIARVEGGGAVASGSLSTGGSAFAVGDTAGTRQYDRHTSVEMDVVAMDGTAAGRAEFTGAILAKVDVAERAERALTRCLDSRGAENVEPGEYTVVLEPAAAAELCEFLAWLGFSADDMQRGRSCLQGRLGDTVCDSRITMVDDPHDPACSPFSFDGEGVPKQRVELIVDGAFRNVVYDQKTATKDNVVSTGNGGVPPNPHGPYPGTLIVSPGEATVDEMIASTDRGLLVTHFHYTNIAERRTCTITGMTRYGLFEIVNGRIARPVKNLRFTQSVLDALNAVEAVGKDRERFHDVLVPALKVAKFRFTGKSDH
jgi:predicted Zn-dependent protease